jgi:hypothetical protein
MTDIEVRRIALESAIAIFHGDPATREFFEKECETDTTLRTDLPGAMAQILVRMASAMEPILSDYLSEGRA